MLDNFLADCKKAKAEVAERLAAIESPAARVGIIAVAGFVAFLIFLGLMPWSGFALAGFVAWRVLRKQ
ncbi:hypothetical protein [Rhizorhabdus sp.]|uniref:hypothetical protein n=1 Tax=Rhizorhabdus sp. TaxID=1968843 RepID=UPI001997CEF5|nr:hypothetical protein [Rhizorhabdus sp.]MBD3762604.1 hypothetical protein [Rhizorhabdus sp.]